MTDYNPYKTDTAGIKYGGAYINPYIAHLRKCKAQYPLACAIPEDMIKKRECIKEYVRVGDVAKRKKDDVIKRKKITTKAKPRKKPFELSTTKKDWMEDLPKIAKPKPHSKPKKPTKKDLDITLLSNKYVNSNSFVSQEILKEEPYVIDFMIDYYEDSVKDYEEQIRKQEEENRIRGYSWDYINYDGYHHVKDVLKMLKYRKKEITQKTVKPKPKPKPKKETEKMTTPKEDDEDEQKCLNIGNNVIHFQKSNLPDLSYYMDKDVYKDTKNKLKTIQTIIYHAVRILKTNPEECENLPERKKVYEDYKRLFDDDVKKLWSGIYKKLNITPLSEFTQKDEKKEEPKKPDDNIISKYLRSAMADRQLKIGYQHNDGEESLKEIIDILQYYKNNPPSYEDLKDLREYIAGLTTNEFKKRVETNLKYYLDQYEKYENCENVKLDEYVKDDLYYDRLRRIVKVNYNRYKMTEQELKNSADKINIDIKQVHKSLNKMSKYCKNNEKYKDLIRQYKDIKKLSSKGWKKIWAYIQYPEFKN